MMTACGCGITLRNPQEVARHSETCSEPKINLGEFEDSAVDLAYAVGYAHVDWRRRARAIVALSRR